jgi:hypothetical protein
MNSALRINTAFAYLAQATGFVASFSIRIVIQLALVATILACHTAFAQEGKEIYQEDPFDLLTMGKKQGGQVLKLVPLKLTSRVMPNPKPRGQLRIRKLDEPEVEYDVNWISVEKIEFFESMVLAKANSLTEAKEFDRAFRHLAFLKAKYPSTPDLAEGVHEFLYVNAASMTKDQPNRAFAILDELFRLSPSFKYRGGRSVTEALDGVVGGLLEDYLKQGDHTSMRRMLVRLGRVFGDTRLPTLAKYRDVLDSLAQAKRDEVNKLIADGNLRDAYLNSRKMLGIWPAVAGGAELAEKTSKLYPIVSVGVLDEASEFDPSAIDNWASRRAGRLLVRLITEYREAGPEGGEYVFPWGTYERSEDLRRLTLIVSRKAITAGGQPLDGYTLARRMLRMADPNDPEYYAAWADLVSGVSVEAVYKVHIDLRRPSMIPESLLQVTLDVPADGGAFPSRRNGAYRVGETEENLVRYMRRDDYPFTGTTQPAEIIERKYKGTQFAIQALLDQDIDAIDRIYPSFVNSLRSESGIKVSPYETPTLHFLVPNLNKPFAASRTFRRALLYGVDRNRILNATLLENTSSPGSRVISGPFPAARDSDDPLAYAYNEKTEPIPYFPKHAVLLGNLAQVEFSHLAARTKTEPPERPTLILAHPSGEQATLAAAAIAAQWNLIGFPCKTKSLPPGMSRDTSDDWHFLYVETIVREPVTDARRLLAFDGVVGSDSDHLGQALRRLETARNWKSLRGRLHDVHHAVFSELVALPLYQVVDHCAYRDGLRGVGDRPSSFYQNIEYWEVSPKAVD